MPSRPAAAGTFVRDGSGRHRLRYTQLASRPVPLPHDLSTGVPDHDLLPSLAAALRRAGKTRLTTSYLDDPVLPPLDAVLRERWPYHPRN